MAGVWAQAINSTLALLAEGDSASNVEGKVAGHSSPPSTRIMATTRHAASLQEALVPNATRPSALLPWLAVPPTFMLFVGFFGQINMLGRALLLITCEEKFGMGCDALNKHDLDNASAHAGVIFSWVLSSSSVLSVLSTSWLAAASDVVGRRPVLSVSAALMLISSLGTFCVVQLHWDSWLLVAFYSVGGIGGTFTSFNAAIFAFTADTTSDAERPSRFSILESSIFLGGMVGALVSAKLLEHVSWSAPFAFTSALYLSIVLYVMLVMPETVKGAQLRHIHKVSWRRSVVALLVLLHPCPKLEPTVGIGDDCSTADGVPGVGVEARQRRGCGGIPLPWLLVFLLICKCSVIS